MEINKNRNISDTFFDDLHAGFLKGLVEIVKKDDTLCMELRGDKVVIYYRGGALYTIEEQKKHIVLFNDNYKTDRDDVDETENKHELSVDEACSDVCKYKYIMDLYFSRHHKLEREFQQLILRENNFTDEISNSTDYYILDIEYVYKYKKEAENINARFDMLAVKWPSEGPERKNKNNLPLVFIEVKYGDRSIGGPSGVAKHIDDYVALRKNQSALKEIADDMSEVLHKKHELGLVTGIKDRKLKITMDVKSPEFIFIFANHDPAKSELNNELKKAIVKYKDICPEILDEIKVAKSSEMGYGLFAYKGKEYVYPTIRDYIRSEG